MVLHIILNKSHKGCSFILQLIIPDFKVNAARKSKVDDNTARMQSIKQLGV